MTSDKFCCLCGKDIPLEDIPHDLFICVNCCPILEEHRLKDKIELFKYSLGGDTYGGCSVY